MHGHWESQTRKLNKHYQSAGRVQPVPLWGEIVLLNCGGSISQNDFDYGLMFDENGIWIKSNSLNTRGELHLPNTSIVNLQGSILPLFYIMHEKITINGVAFPDLRGVTFSDLSGKLKFKYETVNLRYDNGLDVYTETANVILVYIDLVDVPMYSPTLTDVVDFYGVHWDLPFRLPKTSPLIVGVNRGVSVVDNTMSAVGAATYGYTKTFGLDANGDLEYFPPSVGSGVAFGSSIVDPYQTFDPFFGQYGVIIEANNQFIRQGITNADGFYGGNTEYAQYDNFIVGNSNYGIFPNTYHNVEISDNNGMYFDMLAVYEQYIDCGYNTYGTYNGSHVTGWQ